jgi:hypothetical protein
VFGVIFECGTYCFADAYELPRMQAIGKDGKNQVPEVWAVLDRINCAKVSKPLTHLALTVVYDAGDL